MKTLLGNFLLLLLLTCAMSVHAQTNPFDLQYRLSPDERTESVNDVADEAPPAEMPVAETPAATEEVPAVDTGSTIPVEQSTDPTIAEAAAKRHAEAEALADTAEDQVVVEEAVEEDTAMVSPVTGQTGKNPLFLFLMLIAATLLTTLTISSNKNLVNNILRAVLNDNYLNLMYREQKKSGTIHYYILYFVFAVNAGLFLYFALMKTAFLEQLPVLWRCVSLVGLMYLVRHLFLNYLSYVYPFQKEVEQYSFTILIFNIFLGLILLPINVFLAFSPENVANFFLYVGLFFLAIVYIFRQLRGVFISSRLLFNNKFYFLLYLCAVEIAPLAVLFKYAGAYMS